MPTWKACISFHGIHASSSEIQYMSELGVIHLTHAQHVQSNNINVHNLLGTNATNSRCHHGTTMILKIILHLVATYYTLSMYPPKYCTYYMYIIYCFHGNKSNLEIYQVPLI